MKTKIGDIILYKNGDAWISKAIKKLTKSDYNHIGIYVGDGYVAEALNNGFVYTSVVDVEIYDGIDVYRLKNNNCFEKKKLQAIVNNYIGIRYGYLDLLKFLVYIISGRSFFKKESNSLICSEAVAKIYREYGYELFPKQNLDYVAPGDFAKNKKLVKVER